MRIDAPAPTDLAAAPPRADAARIDHVARQLEGQFAQMLVKSMRDASFGDSLFPGENQTFRDLYDQQLSKALTTGKGLGLAPMIARQLSRQSGIEDTAAPVLDTRLDTTGGRPGPTRAAAAALAYLRDGRRHDPHMRADDHRAGARIHDDARGRLTGLDLDLLQRR